MPVTCTIAALDRLTAARAERRPCAPVRDLLPDVDAAYAVRSAWVADRVAAGARVVGRKIGLTNPAVQAQLAVVSTGSGAECLGDPLAAVAWLASTARDYGHPLVAGRATVEIPAR
jgi:2-keto-4-pentenoate hydratase